MRHIQIEGAITKPNQAWTVNVISTSPETPHTSFWPNSLSLYPVPHIHKSLTLHSSVTVSALWSLSSSPLSPPTLQFLLLQLNATPRYVVVSLSLSLSLSFMFCFMSYYDQCKTTIGVRVFSSFLFYYLFCFYLALFIFYLLYSVRG